MHHYICKCFPLGLSPYFTIVFVFVFIDYLLFLIELLMWSEKERDYRKNEEKKDLPSK